MAIEKTFEDKVWILKADVEGIVTDRVKKVSDRSNDWKAKAEDFQVKYQEAATRATTADTLAAQITTLQGELTQSKGAMSRFTAASKAGITDADTIDLLEFSHSKSQVGVTEADQQDFAAWIGANKAKPESAPAALRHLFAADGQPPAPGAPPAPAPTPGAPSTPGAAPAAPQQRQPWASPSTGQAPAPPAPAGGLTPDAINGAQTMDQLQALIAQRK